MNRSMLDALCKILIGASGVALLLGVAMLWTSPALASCGSAVCSVNTDWAAHGSWSDPGFKIDVRAEYVPQDQLQSGSQKVTKPDSSEDHAESHTWNRNLITTVDYTVNDKWGVSVALPYIDRDHKHIHIADMEVEKWHITGLGDARVLGRYQVLRDTESGSALGVQFGAKLPTGATDVKNGDGEAAERTLQPGTGTTDWIAGAYYQRSLGTNLSWFIQAMRQAALAAHDNFRPGDKTMLDTGVRYTATSKLALLVQLNGQWRERDSGNESEPAESGGRSYFMSPGVAYSFTHDVQMYAFYQYAAYQYVNGTQLAADGAAVVGTSVRF